MSRPASRTSLSRRLRLLAVAPLLGALLVGCGQEDDDTSAEDTSSQEQDPDQESGQESGEGESDESAEASDLPDWAPQIITDDDGAVTGLDFADIAPLSDELLIAEVTTGDGAPLEVGQTITANYFGQLPEADAPFDESFSSAPFEAPIGVGSLITGWDEALIGVPVGSRVIMSIPPEFGYGDQGAGADIPGGATLFFVIDIIDAA